jgi:alpha-galactosidase
MCAVITTGVVVKREFSPSAHAGRASAEQKPALIPQQAPTSESNCVFAGFALTYFARDEGSQNVHRHAAMRSYKGG